MTSSSLLLLLFILSTSLLITESAPRQARENESVDDDVSDVLDGFEELGFLPEYDDEDTSAHKALFEGIVTVDNDNSDESFDLTEDELDDFLENIVGIDDDEVGEIPEAFYPDLDEDDENGKKRRYRAKTRATNNRVAKEFSSRMLEKKFNARSLKDPISYKNLERKARRFRGFF